MRIGFVADKLNMRRGGSNFSLDLIARSLSERGHDVTVLTVHFAYENELPESYPYTVVEAPLDNATRVGDAWDVYRLLRDHEEEFDVYHVFNPALLPMAGFYRRNAGSTPVVGRLNSYDVFCTNHARMDGRCHRRCTVARKIAHADVGPVGRLASSPKYVFDTYALPGLLNAVDRLFALSPSVESIYRGIGVDADRLALVPSFYDPRFGEDDAGEVQFDSEQSILYVGTLNAHKGVDVLLDSVPSLPDGVGVEIVGVGPEREALERRAERNGVRDRVTFHGWVDHGDLPAYYRSATVFVHPGLWPEPFNRTLLEAMQCDCPLVVSNVGGPPWVVGECGLRFDRGDSASLAAALTEMVTDDARRSKCQKQCRSRLAEFTPERSVSLLEAQYEAVV